jgi:hypothetical protein
MSRKTDARSAPRSPSPESGLVAGGQGGPEEALLQSGQEEVFSRIEVETGRIEHQAEAGGSGDDKGGGKPTN